MVKFNLSKERKLTLGSQDVYLEKDVRKFIKELINYHNLKIKLAKKNKEITKGEKEAHIICCIDTKMFIKENAGDKLL